MKHLKNLGVIVIFLHFFFLSIGQKSHSELEYNLRPLFELDQLSTGEAYPWISDDGLRLYYTAFDKSNDVFGIWYSDRENIEESFNSHQLLGINSSKNDNISSWLSSDEMTMSFVRRTKGEKRLTEIYLAKRYSARDDFNYAKKVNLHGGIKGTLISPSFTQDLKQLIVFNEYKSHSYILVFRRIDDYNYQYVSELKFPKKYKVKTGKLSNDGLEYYISLEQRDSNPGLYILKRNSIQEDFKPMKKFESGLINDPGQRNHQVYFSSQKNFIVFTRSNENEWDSNGIYIAQNVNYIPNKFEVTASPEDYILDDIVVYPNPSVDHIYFKKMDSRNLLIQVFDGVGEIVKVLDNVVSDEAVNISDMTPGAYYLKIIDLRSKDYRIIKHIKL